MKPKKTPESNLERLRFPLFLLGIAFAGSLVLTAFEWKTYEKTEQILESWPGSIDMKDEVIPIAPTKAPPKPPTSLRPSINGKDLLQDIFENEPRLTVNSTEPFKIEDIGFAAEQFYEEPVILEDEEASFPGGLDSLSRYLSQNVKYPKMARENGVKGKVFVEFVVSETGAVQQPKVLRGIGFGCDEEALNLVRNMPNWNPARINGKRTPVTFRLPVKFTLE
jgi:protein TonB